MSDVENKQSPPTNQFSDKFKTISKSALEKYRAQGVDIGLLLCSLQKTPTQRIEDNNEMLSFIDSTRKSSNS